MKKSLYIAYSLLTLNACYHVSSSTKDDKIVEKVPVYPWFGEIFATANIEAKSSSKAQGTAWFLKSPDGVQIFVKVDNVSPGFHGIHIHEKGDCHADDASSAGDHFNPNKKKHGPSPASHAGDLGNIIVGNDGSGILSFAVPASYNFDWKSLIGKSIVLHAKSDDLASNPSGNSGSRIGCGVIVDSNQR